MKPTSRPFIAFVITIVILGALSWAWRDRIMATQEPEAAAGLITENATFTQQEMERLFADWPAAFSYAQDRLKRLRDAGETDIERQAVINAAKDTYLAEQGWDPARADYLFRYFLTLRNALDKGTVRHRQLQYFRDHYERNEAVSPELRQAQLEQIDRLLSQLDNAPELSALPEDDVRLMRANYDRFHNMLTTVGQVGPMPPVNQP